MKGGMSNKKDLSIHQIRNLQLKKIDLDSEYEIRKIIGCGEFSRVHLALHKSTSSQVALKVVPKEDIKFSDFLREFHYSYSLSPHNNIMNTYDVAFEARGCYIFAQELAPCGDLMSAVNSAFINSGNKCGLSENIVKLCIRQIGSALEFMHSKELVHRDIKAHNILVFKYDFTLFKLTDFGSTRRGGTLHKKQNQCLPTCPPEIWDVVRNEGYEVRRESDVWQMAMLLYFSLTGEMPWLRADITDSSFTEFLQWQKRKSTRTPAKFKRFTPRLMRLFRRVMETKPEKRSNVTEFYKYLDNKWLISRSVSRISDGSTGQEKPKNKAIVTTANQPTVGQGLLDVLSVCGIETTVDRDLKKKRVEQWVMMSASTSRFP